MVQLTVRDVPQSVKDALAEAARAQGQSLQAYLLGVLRRQAEFVWNADLLVEIDTDLQHAGGVGDGGPAASAVLAAARERRESESGGAEPSA